MSNESNTGPEWKKSFRHGADVAEQLRRMAKCFDGVGELPAEVQMKTSFHATPWLGSHTVQQAAAVVDQICDALGIPAETVSMLNGDWHRHSGGQSPWSGITVLAGVLTGPEYERAWEENEQFNRDLIAIADGAAGVETAQAAPEDVRQVAA